ncbi:MAG TPA: hypothetical protein VNP73_02575 [Actinomycetota bacterium]|nr:hypothetical protein [Actinomycetota bacterium]
MERPGANADPAVLDEWARRQLETAAVSDDATRLKILDELHEAFESGLAEDSAPRS